MQHRPRLVIDTNVWIGLIVWPSPRLAAVLDLAVREFEMIASEATFRELSETLTGTRFGEFLSLRERQLSLEMIAKHLTFLSVTATVTDCRDPRDNKFLDLAVDRRAQAIVTGDGDLLALHPWRGIAILPPRQFVDACSQGQPEAPP
ncbi:MAG: putative toxin-antitoxin system toxin component, PIN family [Magnetospirillum sp. WYHS-4]